MHDLEFVPLDMARLVSILEISIHVRVHVSRVLFFVLAGYFRRPMLTTLKTGKFTHFQFLTTNIFLYCKVLTLCHRVHIIFMICDGLRVLFFYPVVQNFGPASLKMSWTVSFKGSGHAFYTGQ